MRIDRMRALGAMSSWFFVGALSACGAASEPPTTVPVDTPVASAAAVDSAQASPARHAAPATSPTTSPTRGEAQTLETEDLVVGTGAIAERGRRLRMTYVGTLLDGTVFDRTLRRPFEFTLGAGEVIVGWDRGIEGMRVGGKRKLVIPGDQGYGAHGAPPTIPPNATLVFEVELLEVL